MKMWSFYKDLMYSCSETSTGYFGTWPSLVLVQAPVGATSIAIHLIGVVDVLLKTCSVTAGTQEFEGGVSLLTAAPDARF
jgi:hypothetical protein